MRLALAIALCTGTAAASGQTCTPREYAQHRQDAASLSGRITSVFGYCSNKRTRDLYPLSSPRAVACDAEMTKAIDALRAAKDPRAVSFALGGCQGKLPDK